MWKRYYTKKQDLPYKTKKKTFTRKAMWKHMKTKRALESHKKIGFAREKAPEKRLPQQTCLYTKRRVAIFSKYNHNHF